MTNVETVQMNLSTGDFKTLSESSIGLTRRNHNLRLYSFIYRTDWLFVESLMIKIDGELFEFDSEQNIRDVASGGYISERNWYTPSTEFIDALKNSEEVSYRLIGKDSYIDFDLKKKKLSIISGFFN